MWACTASSLEIDDSNKARKRFIYSFLLACRHTKHKEFRLIWLNLQFNRKKSIKQGLYAAAVKNTGGKLKVQAKIQISKNADWSDTGGKLTKSTRGQWQRRQLGRR